MFNNRGQSLYCNFQLEESAEHKAYVDLLRIFAYGKCSDYIGKSSPQHHSLYLLHVHSTFVLCYLWGSLWLVKLRAGLSIYAQHDWLRRPNGDSGLACMKSNRDQINQGFSGTEEGAESPKKMPKTRGLHPKVFQFHLNVTSEHNTMYDRPQNLPQEVKSWRHPWKQSKLSSNRLMFKRTHKITECEIIIRKYVIGNAFNVRKYFALHYICTHSLILIHFFSYSYTFFYILKHFRTYMRRHFILLMYS